MRSNGTPDVVRFRNFGTIHGLACNVVAIGRSESLSIRGSSHLSRNEKNASLPTTWAVIILNALWVFDSILLLLIGWIDPTVLGTAFVIFQAAGVALFASLEYVGLRKSLPYFGQT